MKRIIFILFVFILFTGCTEVIDEKEDIPEGAHVCTEQEKQAEMCTMEYAPVCGDNQETYSNGCMACSSGEIDYYLEGECS
jgi:PBP1b-binding outer membrane lipoprotein LpoB